MPLWMPWQVTCMHKRSNLVFFEFLGTTVILFGAFLGSLLLPPNGYNWITPPFVGLAIALTFHKSGAHLNPAVTALVNALPRKHRIQNGVYFVTQLTTSIVIGFALLPLLISIANQATRIWDWQVQVVLLEAGATFVLMSLIATLALNGKAIWTIVAVPAMLYLLALSPLTFNQMNPAVTVAQTIEGLLTLPQLAEHLLGEIIGVLLVTAWVNLWAKRKRPASAN
jgi:glycerol uptake facilitator-like aquaporin